MTDRFPFDPIQPQLDEHAACAIALAISAMGPSFQILQVGSDEQGFFIDGAQHEAIEQHWLAELSRQALQIWSSSWGNCESMVGANLKEFWKYRGQKIRARELLPPLVDVISFNGQRELCPSAWPFKRPPLAGLGWLETQEILLPLKGHREKGWRLRGRALLSREAQRWFRQQSVKSASPLLDATSTHELNRRELRSLWEIEKAWQSVLLDDSSIDLWGFHACSPLERPILERGSLERGSLERGSLEREGWYWGVERKSESKRPRRLWKEPFTRGIEGFEQGNWEQIQASVLSCLHRIRKVVNILGLEVKHHLLAPSAIDLSPLLASVEQEWGQASRSEVLANGDVRWELWGYDPSGSWWQLSNWTLHKQKSGLWSLQSSAVISFDRWLALYKQVNVHRKGPDAPR